MFKIIKLTFLISFLLVFSHSFADTLECSFDNYKNSFYRDSVAKSWIPTSQTHEINGDNIFYEEKGIRGKILENSDTKIKWKYYKDTRSSTGQLSRTKFNFIFFKTTKKASADVDFTGYRDIESVWGNCSYNINQENTNNKLIDTSKTDQNKNKILKGKFVLVRSSSSTDLFFNKSTNTVLVKSSGKYYNTLHKRLLDNPNTDMRIGFFWDTEKKKPKKYMFNYKKPSNMIARLDGYIREIYVQDESFSVILDDYKKYFYVSMTDYEKGTWVASRSEKSQ